jgi:uncharacterized protein (DUF1800 family)
MRPLIALIGILFLVPGTSFPGSPLPQDSALTPRDSALHVLNRLAYGPRPGEVDRVAALGVWHWVEQQLAPERIPDRALVARERGFSILATNRSELASMLVRARRERQARQQAGRADMPDAARSGAAYELRRLAGQVQQLAVVRAVLSERQLQEVMVDFWTNHFNVFFAKGLDRVFLPSYIEETIRLHALGKFEDLLIATARSPAMMFYLDNWESVVPGAVPPGLARLDALGRRAPPGLDSLRRRMRDRMPEGLNENYARELLELHTLGVDGGYTQADVIAVARILTGWSIDRPARGGDFAFHSWAHDRGEKEVRGVVFPPGHAMDEGLRLLRLLAGDPATMHRVSAQLCARFVRDDPPDGCVDDAVAAWRRTDGDMREVLRAIFRSPDFWARQSVDAKVKTPLEFVVSAVRAIGGEPDSTARLAQVVARLGEPLYLQTSPAGYPESQEAWVNSGALLERMNVAVALAAGRLPGVTVDLDALLPATTDPDSTIAAVDERLGSILSTHTRMVLRDQLTDMRRADAALALGLALGGPDFQRQ